MTPAIDPTRLLRRLDDLAAIGRIEGGGVCRLALTDEDKAGRDFLVAEMRRLKLEVAVDQIGNIFGRRAGRIETDPVVTGSHIDTVRTGGRYDGTLGVLAGLEVVEALNDAGIVTERPLVVAAFTNEEGARFQPDMLGSLVLVGGMSVADGLAVTGIDGTSVGDDLKRIGYAGDMPCAGFRAHAFVELHIEQGPVLEEAATDIGVVESVQGISWNEFVFQGVSNHAGTTPMRLRRDAGYVAGEVIAFARRLAQSMGAEQVATVGRVEFAPNLINVVPNRVLMNVDLRNTDEAALQTAERRLLDFVHALVADEGVTMQHRQLARFEPVLFDKAVVDLVEREARRQGRTTRRMPSGAGHDAQMMARICPAGMIFVPSVGGISHNIREFTAPSDLVAGAEILLSVLLDLACRPANSVWEDPA